MAPCLYGSCHAGVVLMSLVVTFAYGLSVDPDITLASSYVATVAL